ncbi:MAG: hypothetical protein SGI92_26620 [Bryobacteraceae bacterium]|nr:hypothetical protein [Bryobacteraceae bacterium]
MKLAMDFDPAVYSPEVFELLALDGSGTRLLPLVMGPPSPAEAVERLQAASARILFADARAPEAAMAGLWLYFNGFEQAHNISQEIPGPDGSYWHGILHRQEPDAGNAGYWFRRVGRHTIFPALHDTAIQILSEASSRLTWKPGSTWDPFEFIDFCEMARRRPGSQEELAARRIAVAEWQLLFHHCASAAF